MDQSSFSVCVFFLLAIQCVENRTHPQGTSEQSGGLCSNVPRPMWEQGESAFNELK